MAARLGNVIYWAACGLALAAGALFYAALQSEFPEPAPIAFAAVVGGLIWAFGWAARYVLAGS